MPEITWMVLESSIRVRHRRSPIGEVDFACGTLLLHPGINKRGEDGGLHPMTVTPAPC